MMGEEKHLVKKVSVVYIPPKTEHGIINTGFENLVFLVTATPSEPLWHEAYEPPFPPPTPCEPKPLS